MQAVFILWVLWIKLALSESVYEGPASIDYFKQSFNVSSIDELPELRCWDEWKEWNGGKKYNTYYGETDVPDISYTFFDETNISYPIKYYRLNLTSKMREKYKSTLHVTTECGLSEWCLSEIYPKLKWNVSQSECGIYTSSRGWERYHGEDEYYKITDLHAHYNQYCNYDSSLDTYIYILYEKKGRINLIESKDDCLSSDNCIVTTKSVIDLTNYQKGVYIIGIGGYGTEYGKYDIELACEQTSYPISNEEIDPLVGNLGGLRCGNAYHNQSWSNDHTVVYYSLNVTRRTYFPFTITICVYEDYSFDAYIIKLDELGLNYEVIIKMDHTSYNNRNDSPFCLYHDMEYGMPAVITVDEDIDNVFVGNMYWIMLQPFINHAMDFSIYMSCNDPPTALPTRKPSVTPTRMPSISPSKSPTTPPKIPEQLVMGLVFGLCGLFILIFVVYYIFKWKQYLYKKSSISAMNSPSYARSPKGEKLLQNDDSDDESDHNVQSVELAATAETHDDEEVKSSDPFSPKSTDINVSTMSIRSLHQNKSYSEQLQVNEDVVQLILSDAIQSCRDQSGFDVYQVLALRYYHELSQNVISRKPFSSIGINIELIQLSPFVTTAFSVIVVGLTQTFGISMVIYKLFMGYFADGDIFDNICSMEEQRWSNVFSLKLLAFLLSLVVTLFVGGLINGVHHDGLYEFLSKLSLQHIERVPHISFAILQIGQGINYYVCFWAVIGSYFIIFVSNTGEEQDDGSTDYSSAGIDMILNAVALFFMLELDDMLVSDEDYNDCEQHLKNVLYQYVPDTRINTRYIEDKEDDDDKGRVSSATQGKFGKYEGYMVPFMYHLINLISVAVTVCCYVSGFIAPFVIFFCW